MGRRATREMRYIKVRPYKPVKSSNECRMFFFPYEYKIYVWQHPMSEVLFTHGLIMMRKKGSSHTQEQD
jgi:hypothetical protein